MNLFHQKDHLCILQTKVALVLILVELQSLFFFTQMFDDLKQLFVLNFQDSFSVVKIVYFQHHKILT